MANPVAQFSIILMGRFPGKDRAVAQALSKAFGQDDTWGLQVVGATPITLLMGLTSVQAQSIYKELVVIEEGAGCRFRVQPGVDESYPSISWPRSPTINGRSLDAFGGSGFHPVFVPMGAGSALALTCPHCRKPIQVELSVPGAPARPTSGFRQAVSTTPIPIPKPVPASVPVGSGANAVPVENSASGAGSRAAARKPVPPPPVEAIEAEDLVELTPLPLQAPPPQRISKKSRRVSSGGVALPEIPVVPSNEPSASSEKSPVRPMDPRLSGPMALEDFERGLMTGPSEVTPEAKSDSPVLHPERSGRTPRKQQEASPSGEGDAVSGGEEDPDQLCSIFIGRNHNPKVHELVAEIQGITTKEAQKICQKSVVPIVKDIPLREADAIKDRFKAIKVNPRVTLKR